MNKAPQINDLVCMNKLANAVIFKVVDVDGFNVGLIDATNNRPNQKTQWIDYSTMQNATNTQLKNAGLA